MEPTEFYYKETFKPAFPPLNIAVTTPLHKTNIMSSQLVTVADEILIYIHPLVLTKLDAMLSNIYSKLPLYTYLQRITVTISCVLVYI